MRIHLQNRHQKELVSKSPIEGRGHNVNYRRSIAIEIMKPNEFYDHKIAKFASSSSSFLRTLR
ncbi:MAG: hypothetical protein WBZ36_27450 [Candidatus Nitrosopolaris sp.]